MDMKFVFKKNTQCSNKTIRVCGDAPTPLYTNSHITYQQSSSSFHLEKYLFTENDIYFSEQIFISLNINLKLKSALREAIIREKKIFCETTS